MSGHLPGRVQWCRWTSAALVPPGAVPYELQEKEAVPPSPAPAVTAPALLHGGSGVKLMVRNGPKRSHHKRIKTENSAVHKPKSVGLTPGGGGIHRLSTSKRRGPSKKSSHHHPI